MRRFTTTAVLALVIAGGTAFAQSGSSATSAAASGAQPVTEPSPVRNIDEWDLGRRNLAIDGYDPVAYFPEGGGDAEKGDKDITLTHKGVVYRFASRANLERFKDNPAKYEPAYGGWCAWAMARGSQTGANPKSFIVKDGRLYLFYDGLWGDTRKDWRAGNHDELSREADGAWREMSGESPRVGPDTESP